MGIALAVGATFLYLATRSVAYPIAFAGLPQIFIGLLGRNPFPNGSIALAMFAWTALALVVVALREDALPLSAVLNAPALATVGLAVLLLVRLSASLDPSYGSFKLRLFLAENLILLLAGIVVGSRRGDFWILLVWLVVTAGLTAFVLARGLSAGTLAANVGGRFTLDQEGSPIGLGRDAARGILVAVFLIIAARRPGIRVLALGLVPLISVAFIAAGSRGPVLGLAVGLFVLLALSLRDQRARWRVLLVAIAGVFGALLVAQLVPGQDVSRALSVLSTSGEGVSDNGRNSLWSLAWTLFREHPLLGTGTGSYAFFQRIDLFPHNLFLELGAEVGILGIVAVLLVVVGATAALVRAYRRVPRDRGDVALVAALLVAAFVNAMVSSDVAGNNGLWLAAGLAVGLGRRVPQDVADGGILRMRGRRSDRDVGPRRPDWPTELSRRESLGQILLPPEDTAVSGTVDVLVEPATTGGGVLAVRLEVSRDGKDWVPAVYRNADAFDVFGAAGGERDHLAVVRSQRLADVLTAQLQRLALPFERFDVAPSQRRPWVLAGRTALVWDAARAGLGEIQLRAMTVDVGGRHVASPPRRLRVEPVSEAAPAAQPALERRHDLDADRAELTRMRTELEASAAALAERAETLTRREQEFVRRIARVSEQLPPAPAPPPAAPVVRPPEPAPVRPPEPAPARPSVPAPAPPAPAPPMPIRAPTAPGKFPSLWELENRVAERPHEDAFVQEERESTIFFLRDYVAPSGAIPEQFWGVVEATFGELLD
jgi:O-antigen ligase